MLTLGEILGHTAISVFISYLIYKGLCLIIKLYEKIIPESSIVVVTMVLISLFFLGGGLLMLYEFLQETSPPEVIFFPFMLLCSVISFYVAMLAYRKGL